MNTTKTAVFQKSACSLPSAGLNQAEISMLAERMYTEHYRTLYRYLCSRLHNVADAEDLAQTVFVKAYLSLKNGIWTGSGDIYYLFTIARNTLIDYFRRSKHIVIASDEILENIADRVTTLGVAIDREQRECIEALIGKLRDSEARALTLRFFMDMEYESIAKLMDKREDAVRQLVHRGLKSLRELLERERAYF